MTQVNSLMRSETEHFYQPNRFGRTLEVAEGRDKLASTEPIPVICSGTCPAAMLAGGK